MPTYTLTIQIDSAGVNDISESGQFVTIVKSVGPGSPVAWVSFSPQESNILTWTEEYSVYDSTTNIEDGAQIITASSLPAAGGTTYSLENGNFSVSSTTGLQPNQYGINNQDSALKINGVSEVVAGLYQGVVINGSTTQSPLNANILMYNETGVFTPVEKIQVFLSSYTDNGYVVADISGNALVVDFTDTTTQTIYYSDSSSQFFLGSLPKVSMKS